MTETEETILHAAIRTFLRYGARKTSMNDIASAAGVSRQTLYDLFGSKEDLIAASTRLVTDKKLAAVRARLDDAMTLSQKLDVYFEETIIEAFELLHASGDADDLIAGYHEAGKAEIARSHEKHSVLVSEILAPYDKALARHGLTATAQAKFIVTTTMGLKTGVSTREDLDRVLQALKANCLSVTEQPTA